MKKTTRISEPRRVVLPLAAAALLAACDDRPGAYKRASAGSPKTGPGVSTKGRSAATRTADGMTRRHV